MASKLELRVSELNRLRPIAQYSFITGMLNRTLKELFTFSIVKSYDNSTGLYSKANSALDFLVPCIGKYQQVFFPS